MTPKNLLITGHTRSGGHFLMNSISMNFDYYQHHRSGKDFHTKSKMDISKVVNLINKKTREIQITRQQAWSFKPYERELKDNVIVLYILRDGRDVIGSLFDMHTKEYKWSGCKKIGSFMRNRMSDKSYEERINIHKAKNPIDSWMLHQKSWIEYFNTTVICNGKGGAVLRDGLEIGKAKSFSISYVKNNNYYWPINVIFYEDLYHNFGQTITNIADMLDMKPRSKLQRPDKKFNSIRPRGGYPGQWEVSFLPEDEKYFNDYVLRHRICL